ncbi:MAG: GxGYxYP family putative glycoside hydrolase [Planctomycetota bacterium]|nr:GxGYxYP family putative glycoside hydrolase [Planctomycetota bacterium]
MLCRLAKAMLLSLLFAGTELVAMAGAADRPAAEPVVYCDLTPLFALDLKDDTARRRFWDETHLAVALQGLVNRSSPRLFLRYIASPDDFWWEQMTQADGWLAGRPVVKVGSIEELLDRFQDAYRGAVVWDERVPATSNLASTVAGCDDLLPLRFDPRDGSLYCRLMQAGRLKVKVRLLRDDGTPLFTGQGKIAGTNRESSGSAKNEAYRWLIEHYVKTGKANPQVMGYYLDAFWHQSWRASEPVNHTLSNHDFVIARRGVLFDLNVWDDEACIDDPAQTPGTDVATLQELLQAAYQRLGGEGVIHVAGFVPWAYKYTSFHGAGGRHAEVPTEWRYAQAKAVSATPAQSAGLTPAFAADGPVSEVTHDGVRCWRISGAQGGRYLYFDVDDAFYQSGSGPLEIVLEFLDQGTGRIVLQYDSTDTAATLSGAYKSHATVVDCGNTDGWRSVAFTVPDARFAGSQNGDADFRVYSSSDNLLIRRARVTRR